MQSSNQQHPQNVEPTLQGLLLRRHPARITDASTGAAVPVAPAALAVGAEVTLYGTTYMLTDADPFTRDYMAQKHGISLGAPVATPIGPLETFKASRARTKPTLGPPSCRIDDLTRFNEARLGKPSHVLERDTLAQFLVRCPGCQPAHVNAVYG